MMKTIDDITTTIGDTDVSAISDAIGSSLTELGETAAPAIGAAIGATAATASKVRRAPRTPLLIGAGVALVVIGTVIVVRRRQAANDASQDHLRSAA